MKHALFILMLLLGANTVVAGNFEDGVAASNRGDYATAFGKYIKPRSKAMPMRSSILP